MPMYQWTCESCGLEVNTVRRVDDRNQEPGTEEGDLTASQKHCETEGTAEGETGNGKHQWIRPFVSPRVSIPPYHRAAG